MDALTREQLASLEAMLVARLDALGRAGPAPHAPADAGELPVSEVESSPLDRATVRLLNDLTLEGAGQRTLASQQLRQALARIEAGSYGFCEECGQAIGAARLMARPEARLCIACQTRAERR